MLQRNLEQSVQGSQSTARSLRAQSQQLPTGSQVFVDDARLDRSCRYLQLAAFGADRSPDT
jgi:hypothetical protein